MLDQLILESDSETSEIKLRPICLINGNHSAPHKNKAQILLIGVYDRSRSTSSI